MGIKAMQGTSSHLEYIGPKGRKYRRNCIYYRNNICKCSKSATYMLKCIGRALCGYYDDRSEMKEKLKQDKEEFESYYKSIAENKKEIKSNNLEDDRKFKTKSKNCNKGKYEVKDVESHNRLLGKTIKLRSLKMQEDILIKIVSDNEQSIVNRKYSTSSNFAKALKGKKVGDIIRVNVINGYLAYKIIDIF